MKVKPVQYTIRRVPPQVDRALRRKARETGKSMNNLALQALEREAGLTEAPRFHDLDALAGTWEADSKTEKALAEQRRIDPDLWR